MVLDENYSQINEISYFTDKENTNNTNYEKNWIVMTIYICQIIIIY